jgi:exodeoxyribonuclease VII small subunit
VYRKNSQWESLGVELRGFATRNFTVRRGRYAPPISCVVDGTGNGGFLYQFFLFRGINQGMKNFEERLGRLEELGALVKKNDIPLDEALAAFEEGIKLSRSLEKDLEKVENRIEILTNGPEEGVSSDESASSGEDGGPSLELFSFDRT